MRNERGFIFINTMIQNDRFVMIMQTKIHKMLHLALFHEQIDLWLAF
jgi:hypothetical protein